MPKQSVAILHYAAPPVVGGVEAVIEAHVQQFIRAGYPVTVIAGRGEKQTLPNGAGFQLIPEIDSQHPEILEASSALEAGVVPGEFEELAASLVDKLSPLLSEFDHLIVHNIFTKHFNIPLTSALVRLLDQNVIRNGVAWCHDFTWTSPNSRSKVHAGYPWDLLRIKRSDLTYVVVSQRRQRELAELFQCSQEEIRVIYNGVDPQPLLGLSPQGFDLINRLGLLESELNLLMPVRVTQAKNIEFALQVVAALKARGLSPRLILTGPPDPHDAQSMEYYQSLQGLRAELGVEHEMRFVFESGPDPENPYFIDARIVGDLYRVSDVMFMPSHREGFGMPVLEAGLAGIPVVSRKVPAAEELSEEEAILFDAHDEPSTVAERITLALDRSAISRLRRRVRAQYTWEAIFENQIEPLLALGADD